MTPTEAKAKYQDYLIKGLMSLALTAREPNETERKSMLSLFDHWTEQSDEDLSAVIEWATIRQRFWNVDLMYRIIPCQEFDWGYSIPACLNGKPQNYGMLLFAIAIAIVKERSREIITDTAWEVFNPVVFGEN